MTSTPLRRAALVTLVAMGIVGAATSSASAHYYTTRCDRDGDDCDRVAPYRDEYYQQRYRGGYPYSYSPYGYRPYGYGGDAYSGYYRDDYDRDPDED